MTAVRVLLAALLMILAASWIPPAAAHTQLVGGCPAGGDVLNELATIELTFAEPLIDDGSAVIDLLDGDDQTLGVGPVVFSEDRLTISVAVVEPVDAGIYVVRVVATTFDGDPNGVDTGFQFQVDPDANPDSDTCELPSGGGTGGWVLLGVGIVAVGALGFFLRPRSASTD